ncbi:hypothetical protein DFJ74DRAFT_689464 [Hyaloraphidium curvatum]|nr:hypothetical protein DFJ74DRAFT_689464 [Hyaloraphidium curvatum]
MLRSVQYPRDDSPFIVDATTPAPSLPERRNSGGTHPPGLESARSMVRAYRFDYSPHPSADTPGTPPPSDTGRLWSTTCYPLPPGTPTAPGPAVAGHPTLRMGDRTRAGFVMYDVTGLQREMQRVEERAKAREREVRQKADFLSTISHEVRTPLHGLLGFAALLDVTPGLSQDQRDLLKAIRDCSESLHSIVNEFLDWSKLDAGKAELELAAFDLREVVGSLGMIWKMQGTRKGVRVDAEVEEGVPRVVTGDVERIKQVLNNMLSNALKFTPSGGHVELRVSSGGVAAAPGRPGSNLGRLSGGSGSSGGGAGASGSLAPPERPPSYMVAFSVRDTGIGISAAGRAKLFQSFAQADASISRKFGGTGLGLAISKGLVELMGGRMDVESSDEPGRSGSRFFFEVPLAVPPEVVRRVSSGSLANSATGSADGPAQPPRKLGFAAAQGISGAEQGEVAYNAPLRLIVAEDNPLNQKLILRLLSKLGYKDTVVAGNGKECYDKVVEAAKLGNPFDLVFMDVQMPICDGFEATELLRKSPDLSGAARLQPFIVAMSASVFQEDQDKCLEVGMDGFLGKPLKVPELVATLKRFWGELQARMGGSEG